VIFYTVLVGVYGAVDRPLWLDRDCDGRGADVDAVVIREAIMDIAGWIV